MKYKIGMFLKRVNDEHGIPAGVAMPYRITGTDGNGIYIQDVYGETQKYKAETVQTEFVTLESGERTWIIHNVLPDTPAPGKCRNVHTHGAFWYDSMDFQVVLPYPISTVSQLLTMMVKRVQAGETFKDGDLVYGLFYEYPIKLMLAEECSRQVLRILIPDENGYFPEDERCNKLYRYQILPMFE